MNVIRGNILSDKVLAEFDAVCCTTNGIVRKDKTAVMGAGNAKAFAMKWPNLPYALGTMIKTVGNQVNFLQKHYQHVGEKVNEVCILSFPTKNNWKDNSDINLIVQSAKKLVEFADANNWKKVGLPVPGCGLGGLRWEEVQRAIENILDDRFYIFFLPR